MRKRKKVDDDPQWWTEAVELEVADKLTEAEAVIRRALDPRGDPSSAQIAYLYEVRCRRLISQGQLDEARKAADKGYRFMCEYASGATSGGEGIALSQEAQDYRKTLDRLIKKAISKLS
ncbi:MAG: hypothetical protein KDB03_11795 [Planctomycetales bacterium]|nr:hypothetical protein [Planctomycetales bacterium]